MKIKTTADYLGRLLLGLMCLAQVGGCAPKTPETSTEGNRQALVASEATEADEVVRSTASDTQQAQEKTEKTDYSTLFRNREPIEKKPYTILVYMNGSNLESDYKMATNDLYEMCESMFDSQNINLIVLTGGTRKWNNEVMKADRTMVFSVTPEDIVELEDLGDVSIVDAGLLTAFIDYGSASFPADRFGFVFWDHGGGPMVGYGYDEQYNGKSMPMQELTEGLKNSVMADDPFEFIGFDCCLMGSLEIACMLAPYADYMIASPDFEPGQGWDYSFLSQVSKNPSMNGEALGTEIVSAYLAYYEDSRQTVTLSVTDLAQTKTVSDAVGELMECAGQTIADGDFDTFSRARRNSKTYGKTGKVSNYDLVDLRHLVKNLSADYPAEAAAVETALDEAVLYNGSGTGIENAYGLSVYIPYDRKDTAAAFVELYSRFQILPGLSSFLQEYTRELTRERKEPLYRSVIPQTAETEEIYIELTAEQLAEAGEITFTVWRQLEEDSDYFINLAIEDDVQIADSGRIATEFDGYVTTIEGQPVCMYAQNRTENEQWYSIPAFLNGEEADILVVYDAENPNGTIVGAVPQGPGDSGVAAKYMLPVSLGDELAFAYYAQLFLEEEADTSKYGESYQWVAGETFTVTRDPVLETEPVGGELYLYGFCVEDIYNNSYYTDFIELQY